MVNSRERYLRSIKIAVIGDVHDQWEQHDGLALQQLGVDLVLLVGDFGNESVEIVREIATLPIPKAVILGNHDAWYSASEWGRKQCPYDRSQVDRVQQQLDLLGVTHVGYDKLDFPDWQLSVIGGRPFSWGGSSWKNAEFYQQRYGVNNFTESTTRIVEAARQAEYNTLLCLGHCGPFGLGERPEDPCGRDWQPLGGDHGDPDLADAIAQIQSLGKQIPLVAFGHMHHQLRHTQKILRTAIYEGEAGMVYLNAARVPRIVRTATGCLRNFSLVTLQRKSQWRVSQISLVWMDDDLQIASESLLYNQSLSVSQEVVAPSYATLAHPNLLDH